MENQHLTYFKVENFKKFDSLEVKDIGQFNLIVGDNNVGKTCLLEALLIDENSYDRAIEMLHYFLCLRNHHFHAELLNSKKPIIPKKNYFNSIKNKRESDIKFHWKSLKTIKYSFQDLELADLNEEDFKLEKKHNYDIGRPDLWIKIFVNEKFKELQFMYYDDFVTKHYHGYLPIIKMGSGFARDLNHYYAEDIGVEAGVKLIGNMDDPKHLLNSQMKSISFEDKKNFIDNLNLFFDDVEDISIKNYEERDILSIKLKKYKDYVPITYFGDGFNIFVRYILEIPKNKGKRIMIDEFGEGIHYSKLKYFCKTILKISKKENVQLFATTHSNECIEAFVEASKELKLEEKIRLISLEEGKNEKIYSTTYNFGNIEAGLYSNVEFRK